MSKNKWIVCGYYTDNTPYEKIINEYLKLSCIEHEIPFTIAGRPNQGDWYKNTAYKPMFALEMLNSIPKDKCIVLLDADSTVEKYPILFDEIPEEYDIAFHTLDWNSWYGHNNNIKEVLTGTMFLRNNKKVKDLCYEWHIIAKNTNTWEQKVLQKLLDKRDIKCYDLPIEYCYMKTRPRGQEPLVKVDPVILHYQASRILKRSVRKENR